jgi:predicted small lipoprotein YifL
MVPALSGARIVMKPSGLPLPRLLQGLALAGALLAALALAACGRKGPLDPPPASSSVAPGSTVSAAPQSAIQAQPGQDPDELLPPTQGPKKRILLDGLLN